VFSPNSREGYLLISLIQGFLKGVIIGVIVLYHDSVFRCKPFECVFGYDRFTSVKRYLTLRVYKAGGMINKDGTTIILSVALFFAFSML
jgi:hypothetical protein